MANENESTIEIDYSDKQKSMFNGFSESLYGNNWFILTTNEAGIGNTTGKSSSICGILDNIPSLEFNTDVIDGPQELFLSKVQDFITGKKSVPGSIGTALGANLNLQLAGNFSKRIADNKSFQKNGISLKFTAWKRPSELFDRECLPSSQSEVINYLSKYATVYTYPNLNDVLDQAVEQGLSAAGTVIPLANQIVNSTGKMLLGGNEKSNETSNLINGLSKFSDALGETVDNAIVRSWSDKQRITHGQEKFNESLHRLDILRAGVLDSYLIVGVKNWSYTLEQESLGEKMSIVIDCEIDQRMNRSRLHLYNERDDIF